MKTWKSIALGCIAAIMLLANCTEKKCTSKINVMPRNPNGDSELALLMRDMFDHNEAISKLIAGGETPDEIRLFEEMKKAVSTEPAKAKSPAYQAMADSYINSVQELIDAGPEERKPTFNAVVDQCMSCHQVMCPGPMVRIKKLYVDSSL